MQLTEKQKKVLEGLVCPYCGRDTELVNADDLYKTKNLGFVRMCRACQAWVSVHNKGSLKGQAMGRLANGTLRVLKSHVHAEFDRLWKDRKDRGIVYRSLSEFLGIPPEYTHIGMFGEKTLPSVLDFCISRKDESGSNIDKFVKGKACAKRMGQIEIGSSACHGCPEFLLEDKNGIVYCDPDMSYGHLKYDYNGGKSKK